MQVSDLPTISSSKQRLAWLVAIVVDAVQIVALPLFAEGGWSPLDTALDILAATALVKLLGWHWAFAPAFLVELVPGIDLFPTWTAAVFYVTRQRPYANVTQQRVPARQPEIIPPDAGAQQ